MKTKAVKLSEYEKGILMNTHQNYLIAFSDGTLKIGTSGRVMSARFKEIFRKKKRLSPGIGIAAYHVGRPLPKAEAYRVERDTCYMLRSIAINGHREWFRCHPNEEVRDVHKYIKEASEVFAGGVGLQRSSRGAA